MTLHLARVSKIETLNHSWLNKNIRNLDLYLSGVTANMETLNLVSNTETIQTLERLFGLLQRHTCQRIESVIAAEELAICSGSFMQ